MLIQQEWDGIKNTDAVTASLSPLALNDILRKWVWQDATNTGHTWSGAKPKTYKCNCCAGNRCPAYSRINWPLYQENKRLKAKASAREFARLGGKTAVRERLTRAFDYTCQYCGTKGDASGCIHPNVDATARSFRGAPWNIDRIDSTRGYTFDNITLACGYCNSSKSNRVLTRAVQSLADREATS